MFQISNVKIFIEFKIGDGSQFDCLFEGESRHAFAKSKPVGLTPLWV